MFKDQSDLLEVRSLIVEADATESRTPIFVWKQIFSQIFQNDQNKVESIRSLLPPDQHKYLSLLNLFQLFTLEESQEVSELSGETRFKKTSELVVG